MMDAGYEDYSDAWESGYLASLHDIEHYLMTMCPWWLPRFVWRRLVAALERAEFQRGSDI